MFPIFVNPTQFLPTEDLDAYPRKDEADKRICQNAKLIMFLCWNFYMYSQEEVFSKSPNKKSILGREPQDSTSLDGVFKGCIKTI